jgi:hypothetical protein
VKLLYIPFCNTYRPRRDIPGGAAAGNAGEKRLIDISKGSQLFFRDAQL